MCSLIEVDFLMKINVIGIGYIGLPTAAILATHGFEVIGVDVKESLIIDAGDGKTDMNEAGLSKLIKAAVNSHNFRCQKQISDSDIFIICVPTPFTKDKKADLNYVIHAVESIIPVLREGNLIILESTVPPGTTVDIIKPLLEKTGLIAGLDFYLAYCPERVLPGNLLTELIQNDRIIGGINKESSIRAKKVYESFVDGNIYLTDATTAELVKIMENTYRAVNIALANEFSLIGRNLKIDIFEAIKLANKHPRVKIASPGAGVGGHCIPIDPWFIVEKFPEISKLTALAIKINENMPEHICSLIIEAFLEAKKEIKNSRIVILGVAYKGDINDARETPANPIIQKLKELGSEVIIYDPIVTQFSLPIEKDIKRAVSSADALVIVTDHSELKRLNFKEIATLMHERPILVDGRNVVFDNEGFIFRGLGQ
jgi:UDP-N-acetyl-D-mannosaminuronic acid dehydrogenase